MAVAGNNRSKRRTVSYGHIVYAIVGGASLINRIGITGLIAVITVMRTILGNIHNGITVCKVGLYHCFVGKITA